MRRGVSSANSTEPVRARQRARCAVETRWQVLHRDPLGTWQPVGLRAGLNSTHIDLLIYHANVCVPEPYTTVWAGDSEDFFWTFWLLNRSLSIFFSVEPLLQPHRGEGQCALRHAFESKRY